MRINYGHISKNGNIISKGGPQAFNVRKTSTGIYDINFESRFQNIPSVVATQVFKDLGSSGGNTLDNVVIVDINDHFVSFKTGDSAGNPSDREFTFIAIGE